MLCAYTRPRYQMSVYRTIGPLVFLWPSLGLPYDLTTKSTDFGYLLISSLLLKEVSFNFI